MIRVSRRFFDCKQVWSVIGINNNNKSGMCDLPQGVASPNPKGRWSDEKKKFMELTLEVKRQYYKCKGNFKQIASIPSWAQLGQSIEKGPPEANVGDGFEADDNLNGKVSIWRGDITALEIDAIVNAANRSLKGGGGVDGAIHAAAGEYLHKECKTLGGCETGQAKITGGYELPAKYVIHTVGPVYEDEGDSRDNSKKAENQLRDCYKNCFKLVEENNIQSVAFPCISTGIYGYPNDEAAKVALSTTRKWLETSQHSEKVDRIIFCVFLEKDVKIYNELMPKYFPLQ